MPKRYRFDENCVETLSNRHRNFLLGGDRSRSHSEAEAEAELLVADWRQFAESFSQYFPILLAVARRGDLVHKENASSELLGVGQLG